jgi:hypothetical protein
MGEAMIVNLRFYVLIDVYKNHGSRLDNSCTVLKKKQFLDSFPRTLFLLPNIHVPSNESPNFPHFV